MSGVEQLVACRIGTGEFALPIEAVREIIRDDGTVDLGCRSGALLGMVDLRGVAMPVFDLRLVLGVEPQVGDRAARRVVVTTGAGGRGVVGWLVDGVDEVLAVPAGAIERLDRAGDELVRSVARAGDGRLLPILDGDVLLARVGAGGVAEVA
jgi:purine-binding chemotaxis protein CheW